jgi:Kef-type K+ transport system membrane component KefB
MNEKHDSEAGLMTGSSPGFAIGILVGLICGTVFLLLLKTAVNPQKKGSPPILRLTASFLALPTFMFGSTWLTGAFLRLLETVDQRELVKAYAVSLAISFAAVVVYPGLRWILKVGEELGRGGK